MEPSTYLKIATGLSLGFLALSPVQARMDTPRQSSPFITQVATTDGDLRIKAALDLLRYKYSLTARKNYEMKFTLAGKRQQTVFINSSTEKYNAAEIRDITSTAYRVKGQFPADLALRFLADNDKRKWGGWRIVASEGDTYLIYAVQIPADAPAEIIKNAVDAVMFTADDMEKELSSTDDF